MAYAYETGHDPLSGKKLSEKEVRAMQTNKVKLEKAIAAGKVKPYKVRTRTTSRKNEGLTELTKWFLAQHRSNDN
jgi:hypothetical protein